MQQYNSNPDPSPNGHVPDGMHNHNPYCITLTLAQMVTRHATDGSFVADAFESSPGGKTKLAALSSLTSLCNAFLVRFQFQPMSNHTNTVERLGLPPSRRA